MSTTTRAVLAAIAIFAVACGAANADTTPAPDAAAPAGMCLEGTPDCVDTPLDPSSTPEDPAAVDEGAMIREAEGLLGEVEEDVLERWPDVRVGRRGDEHMMLTEDYVIGRMTIATNDDGTGTSRVVEVTLELTDGPQILTAD